MPPLSLRDEEGFQNTSQIATFPTPLIGENKNSKQETSLSPKVPKPSRFPARVKAGERAGPSTEVLAKVWSRVLQVLRENIDPHLFARNWEPLELIALDYRRLLVRCRWPREPHEPERAIALIAQAAEQAGMRRGRVVEIEAAVAARSP